MSTFNIKNAPPQKSRIAVITGANSGLGYHTALGLALINSRVILACRSLKKAEKARQRIMKKVPYGDVEVMQLDLNSLRAVKAFAEEFHNKYDRLDILINNAGLMIPPYQETKDGFESQFGVNYLAHFYLTSLLMPMLEKTKNSRVVTLSSIAHKSGTIDFDKLNSEKDYSRFKAYSQSKLACLMFAYELQRRLERAGQQVISVAAHPGVSRTNLTRYIPSFLKFLEPVVGSFIAQSAWQGAQPTLYAALGDDIIGGDYCGPDGAGERKGKPVKVQSTPLSHDKELAVKLWEVSEKFTGRVFEIKSAGSVNS